MAEAQLTNQLTRIDSMTNVELRAELKRRGCPTSGNKKDLLAKLRAALQKEYEQAALDTASTTSTIDSMTVDSRNNSMTGLQQSPVVPFDVNRPLLNTSTASSNNYMTPHGGSPMAYQQSMQTGEVPLTYHNLQMHDQTTGQYPPVYNLTMHQNIHPNNAPMIPVPQQLTLSPAEHHPIYEASVQPQQITPTSRTRGRASADASHAASVSPAVSTPIATPEKKTRSRSKNASMDSRPAEIPVQPPIPAAVEIPSTEPLIHQPTPVVEPVVPADSNVDHSSAINNTIEVNPFVSKSNDEDHHHHHQTEREDDKEKEERGNSRSPSVDSSSAKSESVIKEIPLSGERNRLSRSKSPKSRWHHSPSPQDPHLPPSTNDDDDHRSATPNNDDEQKTAHDTPAVAENTVPPTETPAAPDHAAPTNDSDASKKDDEQPEKAAPQQQLKPSRSQGSTSGSLMKGLNRSTAGNRMNLSSDVLKTLIPDISLAPESVIETELEAANDDEPNDDQGNHSPNRPVLETSIDSGAGLLSDSMNTGDGTEQKQQRNRTVLIDLAVDASSLNDDLMGTNNEPKKKPAAITPKVPTRMASFESKPLLDGKTNALMTDEPVRVKDATVAREPASQIIYIRGLTRPFTPNQLKELLGRYGTLVDGEFWLDKIKSQCFVMYNTSEEAQNAREALDGCRWPSSNPKSLSVRFARQEEFEYTKTHGALPEQMSNDGAELINNRSVQEKPAAPGKSIAPTHGRRSVSPTDEEKMNNNTAKKLRPMNNNDVREWDLPKLQQDKESTGNERQVIEETSAPDQQQTAKQTEKPSKTLDDYFRKTKAKPPIYWLPLTEEQATERAQRRAQRKAEREEEERKRQRDENSRTASDNHDSKTRSNNPSYGSSNRPYRRSPSPRDKRRRVSSSRSPSNSRRDNKRH